MTPPRRRAARFLTVLVLFCTQVFAIVAPGCLVRCVGEDGRDAIELAGSECCRLAHEAEQAAANDTSERPRVRSLAEGCRDIPVGTDQVLVSRTTRRTQTVSGEDTVAALPVSVLPRVPFAIEPVRTVRRSDCPEAVPRQRRSFVLRC